MGDLARRVYLPLLTAYQSYGHSEKDFPNAVSLAARCLSLPMFPELSEEQVLYVATTLKGALGK